MNQLILPARPDADSDDRTKAQKLAEAKEQLQAAFSEGDQHHDNMFQAAIVVGHWANRAREAMDNPSEDFKAWFEKNFGANSKRPRSIQQVYKCMGAAQAYECLPEGKKARADILKRFGTIKALYAIRGPLQRGEDVLALPTEERKPRGRPTKAAQAAKADKASKANAPSADKGDKGGKAAPAQDAGDLGIREMEVKRQKAMNATEKKRLAALEKDLEERERLVALREAECDRREAALGDRSVTDTQVKAPASPPRAARSARKPKAEAQVAPQAENAQETPPDDAEDLSARAQEAVAETKSEADKAMDNPHHGHAPEGLDGLDPANPL